MRYLPWFALMILLAGTTSSGCAPSPRNVACTNDGSCRDLGEDFNYCLESRCVQCVGNSSCGEGNTCVDGACRCTNDRGCGQGERCNDGQCAPRPVG